MLARRSKFDAAMDKRAAVNSAEASGAVADSTEVRMALMERVQNREITLEQAQAQLKKIKAGAKRAGMVTRAQAFSRG